MQGKNLFKAFGLALIAALGLMALTAVGAQAEKLAAPYGSAGAVLIEGKELHALVGGKADGAGTLLLPALSIEIVCAEFKVLEGLINTGGHGTAEVLFEKCHAFELKEDGGLGDLLPCQFLDSTSGTVGHIRAKALATVILHVKLPSTKETYLIFSQVNAETPLSLIHNTTGMGCPLPAKQKVTGSVAFELVTGDLHTGPEVKEPLITALLNSVELFSAEMKYGINPAGLHGSAFLALAGTHAGKTWGAH